ncbi:MAG TPA: Nre family DNA repair protein [Thermoplasmata archaeon]|nr:Nre family DNA repair protein [Thermoplasmata archaeon]
MLTLPMQPPSPQFGALFDADTRAAIASGLCVSCRGAKLLCGKSRCPIMVRWDSMMKTAPMIDRVDLDGSSPPGVFVGRFGYPKVFVGPLVPPVHGDTQILDLPEDWVGLPLDDIVRFRSQLVRGMHRVHVMDVERGGRLVDSTRELALATSPAEVEAGFSRRPHGRVILDDNVQPFGPSAPLTRLDVGTLKVDAALDRAYSDTDLKARDAVLDLFDRRVPVSKIQRAFSVGAFGIEKDRRFVPTRWSITAVDDTIGKTLREHVKASPLINEIRVYEAVGYDDRFLVVMVPRPWRYELIEAWYPNTLWNPLGREVVMFGDHEGFEGRTTYASIGGCYYAARLAVGEALIRERRQAATVILRETHPGYIMPIGVWNVREHVREALRRRPAVFDTMAATLSHLRTRLDIPMERYVRVSEVLKHVLYQRTFDDFVPLDSGRLAIPASQA